MTPVINQNGIAISDFTEIFDELVSNYQTIYGSDIDLSQNTPDGQIVGIDAKIISDFSEFAVSLYNTFDPDYAIGLGLDKILKLNGLKRQQSTKSSVDITLVCSKTVELEADYTIVDALGQKWVIDEAKTVLTGTHLITFYSQDFGKYEALPETITEFDSIVLGVKSVTNLTSAIAGIDEDTDEQVRIKRNLILQRNSSSTIGGLIGKLYDFCTSVKIYENRTNATDSVLALDGNSIWVVCEGGEIDDIAKTIAIETTACGLKGSVVTTYTETFTRSNNETFDYVHTVKFDRPTYTEIYIRLDVLKKTPTSEIDIDLIKTNIAKTVFGINEDVLPSSLYYGIFQSGNSFIPANIEVSSNGTTYYQDRLVAGYKQKYLVDIDKIAITLVWQNLQNNIQT